MRVALVDADSMLRDMVEALIERTGHEVVGVADTTPAGVGLLESARPDALIFDMALGFNSDFDLLETAASLGVKAIVFSQQADDAVLRQHPRRPVVVFKPDLDALEHVLDRLVPDEEERATEAERRQAPARAAKGPVPTSVADAQAFYEALNEALPGDAIVSLDLSGDGLVQGERVSTVLRGTDRLLASSNSIKVFLVAGGDEGIASLLRRIGDTGMAFPGTIAHSIVVQPGEEPIAAFDRLKASGEEHHLPID